MVADLALSRMSPGLDKCVEQRQVQEMVHL